jgi:hypothetical protein
MDQRNLEGLTDPEPLVAPAPGGASESMTVAEQLSFLKAGAIA